MVRQLATNTDGAFYCLRAALREMLPRSRGSIVLISSLAGIVGVSGLPHYSASKAAVLGLMRSVAQETAGRGTRVNAIAPGGVTTAMTRRTPPIMRITSPMHRLGEVDEIAAAALFLACDDSSYVTGETLNVNGGIVIG